LNSFSKCVSLEGKQLGCNFCDEVSSVKYCGYGIYLDLNDEGSGAAAVNLSSETTRALALWKQGFHRWPNPEKTHVLEVIRRLGCVQIDTINVVERSHYLALWSRLGPYNKEYLDQLLYPDRKVFEFWAHAASIIPIEDYRYFGYAMKEYRRGLKARAERRLRGKAYVLDGVLDEIRRRGPLTSKDFEDEGVKKEKRHGWWDWKPAKIALEMLYDAGILMVSHRRNFQRYYDLTENILPSHIDTSEPTEEERRRFFAEKAFDAMGVAKPEDVANYYYQWCTRTPLKGKVWEATLQQLLSDDVLGEVTVEGDSSPYYMLTKDYEIVRKIAGGEVACFDRATFLSPFDNLTWSKGRIKRLFNFTSKLEAYLPEDKRRFGYYAMNILYKNRLVGRFDPKFHRDRKVLEVKTLHLEEGFRLDAEFEEKLADAFKSLMEFNGAKKIQFGRIIPDRIRIGIDEVD